MQKILLFPISLFTYFVHKFPDSVKGGVAWFLAILWFDILRIRRRAAVENVGRAFPHLTTKARHRLARHSLYHMCLTLLDFASFPFMNRREFERRVTWHGREHIDRALEEGHGVLAISAHLGNGDFGGAALAQWGYKISIISKIFKSEWLNHFWFTSRKNLGVQFIPPRQSSYQILKTLKRNEIVVFVMDQYTGPPNGIKTKFFGHDTGTALGMALLASRSKAPVIPLYTYRTGVNTHVIVAGPPLPFMSKGNPADSLLATTQQYNDIIETWVRAHPEQWMWIHRRWKIGFA